MTGAFYFLATRARGRLLNPSFGASHHMNMDAELIIVGAGISGLVLARELTDRRHHVRVLEARERVGGRTTSFEVDGAHFDLGASWVWETEKAVLSLVDSLGLEVYPSHRGGIDLFDTDDGIQRVRLPDSPVPEYRIDGGAAAIARVLAEQVEVESSRPVRRIRVDGDALALELDDETLRAKTVVFAAPPALLARELEFEGNSDDQMHVIARTPVWMGEIAKVVAVYERPFWLEDGLSGRVFSHRGPMVEIHDLSGRTRDRAPALFGFVPRSRALGDWKSEALDQLVRLFGPAASDFLAVEIKTWWEEQETTPTGHEASQQLIGHPFLRRPLAGGRLHLASTETASSSAGHIEGAVQRAFELARTLA